MTKRKQKSRDVSDFEALAARVTKLEQRQERVEQRLLKAEVNADTAIVGQGVLYQALQTAGLVTRNGEPTQLKWDPEKIAWTQATGAKGPYERYPGVGERAESSEDYRKLLQDLKVHQGKFVKNGWFYWVFSDSTTIGRKRKH